MKRTFAFATLLGALVAVAALVSSSASAVTAAAPQTPSHIKGVVPLIGKQVPGAGIPLTYHGGPVMTTNKTYAIYWKPAGFSMAPGYDTTINQYFTDVAADSGKSTNVYATDTQYSGIQYSSSFGGSFTDTNAYPASGCPLYGGLPVCLTDAQLQTEIDNVIASQGWVKNGTSEFFMFTAQNVGSCFDSGGSQCAFTVYCAYHGTASSGAIYANQPYVGSVGGCDQGQYPNGSSNQADPTINVTSHEHNESITDPQLNAWYDSQGNENGDKCAWKFGTVSGSNGSEYNQMINSHHYFLQMEWSNNGSTCLQTYSGGGGGNPPQIFSFSPTRGRHGTFVTISGKNFTGTTAVAFVRGLVNSSASFSVLSNTQIRVTVPTVGVGYGRWKVTNPGGSATSSGQFYVTG